MNSDDESVDIIVPNMSGLEREEKNDCDSRPEKRTTLDQWTTVIILCFVNLINYMDRYTIAGMELASFTHEDLRGGCVLRDPSSYTPNRPVNNPPSALIHPDYCCAQDEFFLS